MTADERCPAAHAEDPTPCDGPADAVVIFDYPLGGHGSKTGACEHHGARLLASLTHGRVHPGSAGPGSALRVYYAAQALPPFAWRHQGEDR